MALTDMALRNAKPGQKTYTLSDGSSLYLYVQPNGSKLWRYRFRWLGRQQTYSIGEYPQVGLGQARIERDRARGLVSQGLHPTLHRKLERIGRQVSQTNTFEAISREYLKAKAIKWSQRYIYRVERFLAQNIYSQLGSLPISEISSTHLLEVLRAVERRGAYTVAAKLRIWVGGVFRYAIATGRANGDPCYALRNALHQPPTVHAEPLAVTRIPNLIQAANDLEKSEPMIAIGIKLLLLTFVRGSELRLAKYSEFDLDNSMWRVPAEHTKLRQPHIVPLSRQACALVARLQTMGLDHDLLFPSPNAIGKSISEPMWRKGIEKLGFKGVVSPHGFRATASTLLNEAGFNADWIERQLGHAPRDRTRASYNSAQFIEGRKKMMQDYADMIDVVCLRTEVVGVWGN